MTSDSAMRALESFEGARRVSVGVLTRAEAVVRATVGLAPVDVRISFGKKSLVLTWALGPGRTLVWYVDSDDGWRPARVVQQGDPRRTHWADVGDVDDLAAILREELGVSA